MDRSTICNRGYHQSTANRIISFTKSNLLISEKKVIPARIQSLWIDPMLRFLSGSYIDKKCDREAVVFLVSDGIEI
jgi:hypothetical protein